MFNIVCHYTEQTGALGRAKICPCSFLIDFEYGIVVTAKESEIQ